MSTTEVEGKPEEGQEENTAAETSAEEKQRLSLEVKIDKPSACERHITVSVAQDDVARYLKEAFNDLMPKAELPGFRPGRAPRKLVESRFKDHVADQVKGKILMDSLSQMSDDHQFTAISEPDFNIDSVQLPSDGPMVFEFDIEVRPEFDVPRWKGLTLERPAHEYSEDEVQQRLNQLLSRYGGVEPHEGPIEAGHFVTMTLRVSQEGRQLSQLTEETIEVKPTLSFVDAKLTGFDKLLIGKQAGDTVTTKLTIAPESEIEEFRGKEVDLSLEIVAVERRKLPELTRDFLDRIGGFKDEGELKNEVRTEMERQLKFFQQKRTREQITAQLTVTATWDLPQDMLRRQARRELDRALMELQSNGFSNDQIRTYMNELHQNAMATTGRALKEHFILEKIAEDEKIEAEPDDYDKEIELIADQSDETPRRVRARIEKKGLMDTLRNQIVERKVIELIQSEAEFRDVPYSPPKDEVVAVNYTAAGASGENIPEAEHDEGVNPATIGKTKEPKYEGRGTKEE
jgi:trigger factor